MRLLANTLTVLVVLLSLCAMQAWAAKPYKIYVINKYGAYDIVCDSYTVKKNDHIWDILRRRGSIAEKDFPRFVRILKDMNPGVKDVDKIYPTQKILVPLKEISAKEIRPDGGQRYVTIPMIPDVLYKRHEVNTGECLSKVIATHLHVRWDQLTDAYIKNFRRLNPRVKDLNVIYPGQTLRIPELASLEMAGEEPLAEAPQEEQKILNAHLKEAEKAISAPKTLMASAEDTPLIEEHIQEPIAKPLSPKETEEIAETKEASPKQKSIIPPKEPSSHIAPIEIKPVDVSPPKELPNIDAQKLSAHESEVSDAGEAGTDAESDGEVSLSAKRPLADTSILLKNVSKGSGTTKGLARTLWQDGVNVITAGQAQVVPGWQEVVSMVVSQIGGKLLGSGHCYFPAEDQADVALDLAAFPVLELNNGRYVLLEKEATIPPEAENIIRNSWKDLFVIQTDVGEKDRIVLDKVFRGVYGEDVRQDVLLPPQDDGILVFLKGDWIISEEQSRGRRSRYYCITLLDSWRERTSSAIVAYLQGIDVQVVDMLKMENEQSLTQPLLNSRVHRNSIPTLDGSSPEAFVSGFVKALGFLYESQVPLSFEYGGFEVQTAANVIYGRDGFDLVVDFGTFYGDAKAAIEAGGMNVLSVGPDDALFDIAGSVLNILGSMYSKDPEFFTANREQSRMVSLAVPGFLISDDKERKFFLPRKKLPPALVGFLSEQQIEVFEIRTKLHSQNLGHL